MIRFLLSEFDGTPLVLILTTHVADPERDARVCVRNRIVCELARKYGLPVIDFYKPTNENPHS